LIDVGSVYAWDMGAGEEPVAAGGWYVLHLPLHKLADDEIEWGCSGLRLKLLSTANALRSCHVHTLIP
jgi:hypothetical protein